MQQPRIGFWCYLAHCIMSIPSFFSPSFGAAALSHFLPVSLAFLIFNGYIYATFSAGIFFARSGELSWSCLFLSVPAWTDVFRIITQFPFQFHSKGQPLCKRYLARLRVAFLVGSFSLSIGVYPQIWHLCICAYHLHLLLHHHISASAWIERRAREEHRVGCRAEEKRGAKQKQL